MTSSSFRKPPWNPSQIAWICVLFGAFPGVVLWIVNNRRLGLVSPLATRVFVGASLVIYSMILLRLLLVSPGNPLELRFRALNVAMTIIVAWQLYLSQRAAFARHRIKGGQTASVWVPLGAGIIGLALVVAVSMGVETVRYNRDSQDFERALVWMSQSPTKTREAEIFFRGFKTKYPEEPMTYWNLAIIYVDTEREEKAKFELKELLKLEPNNREARDFLRELEESK